MSAASVAVTEKSVPHMIGRAVLSSDFSGMFFLQDCDGRFDHSVGTERDAVDLLLDQKLREFRVIAWCLAADADVAALDR